MAFFQIVVGSVPEANNYHPRILRTAEDISVYTNVYYVLQHFDPTVITVTVYCTMKSLLMCILHYISRKLVLRYKTYR